MRRLAFCVAVAAVLTGCARKELDQELLRRTAAPAVVRLCTFDADRKPVACGDAFALSNAGLMVSSYRAIRGATQGDVQTPRGGKFRITRVIAFDPQKDFAVFEVAATGWTPLKASALLSIDSGAPVLACRFPQDGAVSGQIRGKQTVKTYTLWTMSNYVAGIGGTPVLNADGIVVGMTLSTQPGSGSTLVLPIHYVLGSISSKPAVTYTLTEVAMQQQSADRSQQEASEAARWGTYGDRYGAFQSVAPRNWKMQESEHRLGDEAAGIAPSYELHVLFMPPNVSPRDARSDLEAGIRVRIALPDRNRTWFHQTENDLIPALANQMISERPGFTRQRQANTMLGQTSAGFLDIAGAELRIRLFAIAGARCRVLVEFFSPARSVEYDPVFEKFRQNFRFIACPEYHD